ncbi:MAG: hypothetical protein AUI11_04130 [Acidobacteria bacterium 13_2_20CM_2_66_4]|nr:MAG: hypothetical protein AUI11_04130 [Acidobacteria bacterium 13_2_20CM_2_66_4]
MPHRRRWRKEASRKRCAPPRRIKRLQPNPLGTGAYHVVEWKSGEYILLERTAHYWRGDEYPRIRRLLFKFIPNTNTRINQLKNGEVHVVALARGTSTARSRPSHRSSWPERAATPTST